MYEFMNLNPKGVSYNREQSGRKSDCVNARNPNGHNPECPRCKTPQSRPSQQVPYWEHPMDSCGDDCVECNKPAHGKWGRDVSA